MKVIYSQTYKLGKQTILRLITDEGHEIKAHESQTNAGRWWCYWMNDKGWTEANELALAGITYDVAGGPGTYGHVATYLTPATLAKWLHPLTADEWNIEHWVRY